MSRRPAPVVIAGVVLFLLAACAGGTSAPTQPGRTAASSPFAACPAATAVASETGGRRLPSISLPCFTGGQYVDLTRLGQPVVINFWASTCGPCRTEMPELQRFSQAVRGRLLVVGVDTGDDRTAAASAGADFGATYPMLFDPQRRLLTAWGRQVLPVTLFVDASGVVRGEDLSGALTESTLDSYARRYLGITP